MQRVVCSCLSQASMCEACGAPCLRLQPVPGWTARWHLLEHVPLASGFVKVVFQLHTPEACRAESLSQLLLIRASGVLLPEP